MGLHDPFEYLKHNLWLKEGLKIKMSIWLLPIKVKNRFEIRVQVTCHISLESFWQRLQLFFTPHLNQRSAQKVMAFQNAKSPNFRSYETNWHLNTTLMVNHTKYYKGESGGFSQIYTVVNFMSLCMPMVRSCTKNVLIT